MQKFHKGDLVRIAKDLGSMMSHFESDCDAIVKHGSGKNYCLYLKGMGEHSWYEEWQLTLIESDRLDLLKTWQEAEKQEDKLHGDLDWIFNQGGEILRKATGATISALAKTLGICNLWGSHGEGFTYYQNAISILGMVEPFLKNKDKNGWLEYVKSFKGKYE